MEYHQLALYVMIGGGILFFILMFARFSLQLRAARSRGESDALFRSRGNAKNALDRYKQSRESADLSLEALTLTRKQRALGWLQFFAFLIAAAAAAYYFLL